jgi:hypothetical protein
VAAHSVCRHQKNPTRGFTSSVTAYRLRKPFSPITVAMKVSLRRYSRSQDCIHPDDYLSVEKIPPLQR